MKIMTILGTRPEIIRLSLIIGRLDALCEHILVHTGQNYDPNLSRVFFEQLEIRAPDHYLGVRGESFGEQIGQILARCENIFREEQPDRILILGDTNSALSAIIAKRMGIPVFHMEAGNRCNDDRVPEEVNRRIIDHCSDVLIPYTERSRANLLREGIPGNRIFVMGNPIYEVIQHFESHIAKSPILEKLELEAGRYLLVTMHRAENVDVESRLRSLCDALCQLNRIYQVPVICGLHPRTRNKIAQFDLRDIGEGIRFVDPFTFFDFIHLEQQAMCVLSDSGTVQEECAIFRVPNVTIRDVTERPETIEVGSNILSGVGVEDIQRAVSVVTRLSNEWIPPVEYTRPNVSAAVVRILLSYLEQRI